MGVDNLRRNGISKNGAEGAYKDKEKENQRKLVRACEGVLNYLKQSGTTIHGITYGSDRLLTRPECVAQLYQMVSTLYQREYGEAMPFAALNIIDTYGGVRKGNYERMRDGVSIPREYHPLFGDTSKDGEPIAIVYAYWGSNQKAKRRLIKIGYTSQDLATYLRNLQRAYDPRLMATRCGGRHEEDIEHALYRLSLAEGREWFYPTPAMFDTFRRVWDVTPEFDIIAEEALSLRY